MVHGVLESGAIASVHVGAVPYAASGWRMEIYGRNGTLRATRRARRNAMPTNCTDARWRAVGAVAGTRAYTEVPEDMPVGPPRNVGHLYIRLARAIRDGTPVEPDFDLAVRRHRLIDAIQRSSDTGRTLAIARDTGTAGPPVG